MYSFYSPELTTRRREKRGRRRRSYSDSNQNSDCFIVDAYGGYGPVRILIISGGRSGRGGQRMEGKRVEFEEAI